ncbi:MAG: hypothetical protein CL610_18395 [Anaerolineaceae bacterium]|nr:hypothetical protein [Anaerolineaceae bacterium]
MRSNRQGIAYYRQIADILIKRIHNGVYAPGEQLPSDRELSAEFGHNRHTVRRALDVVAEHKLITRQQGRGTFVTTTVPAAPEKRHLSLGLIDMTRQLGARPAARVLEAIVRPADQVAEILKLKPSDLIIYIHRLRYVDNTPMILEYISIPYAFVPGIEHEELSQSLRDLMVDQFDIHLTDKEVTFESNASDGYVSQMLNIPLGSPVMLEKRLSYDADQTLCEYSEHIYRGDRFAFRLK